MSGWSPPPAGPPRPPGAGGPPDQPGPYGPSGPAGPDAPPGHSGPPGPAEPGGHGQPMGPDRPGGPPGPMGPGGPTGPYGPAARPGPGVPPARRGRRSYVGLFIGLGAVALVFVIAVAVAVGGYFFLFADKAPAHRINAPDTAGNLAKDQDMEPGQHPAFATMMAAMARGGVKRDSGVTAVYQGPPERDGAILFVGGTGDVGDPREYLTKARPATEIGTPLVTTGQPDGQSTCGTYTIAGRTFLYCAWATENSFGFLTPSRPVMSPAADQRPFAETMREMRSDMETTAD